MFNVKLKEEEEQKEYKKFSLWNLTLNVDKAIIFFRSDSNIAKPEINNKNLFNQWWKQILHYYPISIILLNQEFHLIISDKFGLSGNIRYIWVYFLHFVDYRL